MNRRRFLRLLGLAAATAAADPEALLWTPGTTTHILPPLGGWRGVTMTFSAQDLAFDLGSYSEQHLKPAIQAIADKIDADVLNLYRASQLQWGEPYDHIEDSLRYLMQSSHGPWRTTHEAWRQQTAENLNLFIKTHPEAYPALGDLLVQSLDWPDAHAAAARLREALPPHLRA